MNNYKIYLAGDFISTDQHLPVENPYNGEVFATTFLASAGELEKAIARAESIRTRLEEMPSYRVSEALFQISGNMKNDREKLAKVLAMESGKPIRYALGEIDRAAQTFLVAAEESKRIPGEYLSLDWTPAGEGKEAWVKYFPVGLIAGIAPFNFPMNLAVHKIAPALASRNPIILKPARSTPLSVLELARIIDQTGFPKGALSILPMDRESGNQLVKDNRFKMLTFTGSPEVGWKMKTDAGKKKVVLELGGNAGVIVAQSAPIEKAVERCLIGGFAYSGQVCIHVQRIYVHESLFNGFAEKFVQRVEQLKAGDPLDPSTDISVMIDEENAERVSEWVGEAVKAGGKILTGGEKQGAYFQPTVLTNTKNEMKVCSLEIFGPVVTLEPFSSFQQALDEVNNSRYGLQAGVFTNSLTEMNLAFNHLQVGGVIINDIPTFRVDHMPYGGVKDSGLGREGVKYAIHEMLEPRLLVKDKT
jgi:acyl-CoA reductase-like NAD-dependent aldehyde dehydrogenase